MKRRGMLSFAVAAFVTIVLLYSAAIAISLKDSGTLGQKRMEVQLLSQRYSDAVAAYNATVMDAIVDAAYNSANSKNCRAPAATAPFESELSRRIPSYIAETTQRLNSIDGQKTFARYDGANVARVITSASASLVSVIGPCASEPASYDMNKTTVDVAFFINETNAANDTGYYYKLQNWTYDVYLNHSTVGAVSKYIVMVAPSGQAGRINCFIVSPCP